MIPRFKPYVDREELKALFSRKHEAVEHFEAEFARTFEAQYALAFSYGRSALWAFFKAMEIEGAEVILPAYTCAVVAHAIVLSGNLPRFVDITFHDYNMDLEQVEAAMSARTQAVIATHLFGYPLHVERLGEVVRAAERKWGHKIWIIQDCAHAFGARRQGKLVCNEGDVALYGLNISKMITSIFGGMLTTNDPVLYGKLRTFRDKYVVQPGWLKHLRRSLYLLAVYLAFDERLCGLIHWLQEETSILDRFTKAYHLDDKIHFPPDYLDMMLAIEAQVGLSQLHKYASIVQKRCEIASFYHEHLREVSNLILPPLIEGATYSHYVVRVPDRRQALRIAQKRGVQLGELIQYSIPHMDAYRTWAAGGDFPNSYISSQHTINLPIHHGVSLAKCEKIVDTMHILDQASASTSVLSPTL